MSKRSFFSAKNITAVAILLALVIVLQAFGGSISIGVVSLNFTLIPIVVGAIVLGPWAGAFLGFASGVVVWIQVIMGGFPFYVVIWTYSPVVTTLICLVKTTVAGWLSGFVFALLKKKNQYLAIFLASGLAPLVNTGLFLLGCMEMWNTIAIAAEGGAVLAYLAASFLGVNFLIEFVINLLVSPSIHTVYKVVEKRYKRRRK